MHIKALLFKSLKKKLPLILISIVVIFAFSGVNAVHALGVTAIIPVGARPEGITYDSGLHEVFVANYGSNSVSVISDRSNAVIATVPVGNEPAGVIYDSNKSEIFVANDGSGTVSVISYHKYAVIATVAVGSNPVDLAYDFRKGEIFVTNWGSNTISVISDNNNTLVATIPTGTNFIGQFPPSGPAYPIGVAYDSVKGLIYVVNSYSDSSWVGTVSVISDSNNTVLESIPVGVDPYYAAFDSGMGEIFVTNDANDFLSVISDTTNTVVANVTLPEGASSRGIAYDSANGELFAVNAGGTVFVLSDGTNSVVESVPLSNATVNFGETDCIAYDAGTGEMFVTNSGDSAVLVLAYATANSATSSPTIPEFSGSCLVLVTLAIVAIALCTVVLVKKRLGSPI